MAKDTKIKKYLPGVWRREIAKDVIVHLDFLVVLVIKNPPAKAGDIGDADLIPGWGRFPGWGHSNPLQHSSLENPHGQRSLAGYSPQGGKELKVTEATEHSHTHMIVQPFTKTSERLKCSVQKKGSLKRFKGMTYSSLQSRKLKCYPSASSAKAKNRNGSSQKDTWNWLLSNAVGPHDICRRSISFLRILYKQKQCQFGWKGAERIWNGRRLLVPQFLLERSRL